jgi:phospho-N-acetylmuramoyl-pentapeptide-transferase
MIALLVAASVSFLLSVVITPLLMKFLRSRGMGQHIRDDAPFAHPHLSKAGTPTMGGIAIVVGSIVGYACSHVRADFVFGRTALVIVIAFLGMAAVGFIDDILGVTKKRNLGLRKRGKFSGQLLVSFVFAFLATHWVHIDTRLSFARPIGVNLPTWIYIAFIVFLVTAAANAVNITDGLDGLAAGSSVVVFLAFVAISFWQFRHPGFYSNGTLTFTDNALDIAVLAAALSGASAGFLWWNAAPAQIFMGDVGSLALGGAMAACAVMTNTELLFAIIGGIYLIETLSVIAQIISYRAFKRRIFKMAPIHHHFEVLGWPETTVIVRFWLMSGICVAMGVGLFYADFLHIGGGT